MSSPSTHLLSEFPIVEALSTTFHREFCRAPEIIVRAPGRVNLLGAHVDYVEGWVLPATVDRAIWLAAAPAATPSVTIHSAHYGETAAFDLDDPPPVLRFPTWARYPMGVAWALRRGGYRPSGMQVVVASDIPISAGLSSSAALEVAMTMAWEALSDFNLNPIERAQIGQSVENKYVGVASGIMDQFVVVHGRRNHMILLDCRTLSHEAIPIPAGTAVIIADSGVRRELAQINYNDGPEECRAAAAILRQSLPHVVTLRDVTQEELEQHVYRLPPELRRRARHAVEECARVLDGAEALRQGDLRHFGALIRLSQSSSRDNYENSIPELDLLATTAWQMPGCYGARFAGGGFGGTMQVLAEQSAATQIQTAMSDAFLKEFGRTLSTFTCAIADGAKLYWL